MTIRPATIADVPEIVRLGRAFRAAVYADSVADNPSQMHQTATQFIDQPSSVIFVAEDRGGALVGMIGLIAHVHFISGVLTASEAFWFVDPLHRGSTGVKLLHRAMAWARERGATAMAMVQPHGAEDVGALYLRLGFMPIEVGWQLNLTVTEAAA